MGSYDLGEEHKTLLLCSFRNTTLLTIYITKIVCRSIVNYLFKVYAS